MSNPADRWTVYGRKRATVRGLDVTAGVHAERLPSRDAADLFLTKQIMLGGHVEAVIVHLVNGEDTPETRHVVRRIGGGKAWWE